MFVLCRICCPEQVECRIKLNDMNEGMGWGGLLGVETGNGKLLTLGWKHPWYIQGSMRRSLCLEMSDWRSSVRRGQRRNGGEFWWVCGGSIEPFYSVGDREVEHSAEVDFLYPSVCPVVRQCCASHHFEFSWQYTRFRESPRFKIFSFSFNQISYWLTHVP